FFFQAEDGIRDRTVTGVQTCALPIYSYPHRKGSSRQRFLGSVGLYCLCCLTPATGVFLPERLFHRWQALNPATDRWTGQSYPNRSEERRVGKECRLLK